MSSHQISLETQQQSPAYNTFRKNRGIKKSLTTLFSKTQRQDTNLELLKKRFSFNEETSKMRRLSTTFFHLSFFATMRSSYQSKKEIAYSDLKEKLYSCCNLSKCFLSEDEFAIFQTFLHDQISCKTSLQSLQMIGKCIFLFDHCLDKIKKTLSDDPKLIEKNLKKIFIIHLAECHLLLKTRIKVIEQVGNQNGDIVRYMEIPREISGLILTSEGFINTAIFPYIMKEYLSDTEDNQFNTSIKMGLSLLSTLPSLKEKIESINIENLSTNEINFIVRSTFRFPLQYVLKNNDFKRCVTSAFLTHLRQGESGSCFASFLAIEQQKMDPEQVLADFCELIEKSQIYRSIDHQLVNFPFVPRWYEQDCQKRIRILSSGLLEQSSPIKYLWEDPSLIAALKYLGIDSTQKFISDWISKKINSTESYLILTIRDFLFSFQDRFSKQALEEALMVYSSNSCHPLLRIWENSLAGMAEGETNSLLKTALTQTLTFLLRSFPILKKRSIWKLKLASSFKEEYAIYMIQHLHKSLMLIMGPLSSLIQKNNTIFIYGKKSIMWMILEYLLKV